jgi:NAD-dependent deacetylase sirtuin 4
MASPLAQLALRARHGRLVVLSGAGISTESGIPDYRSPGRPPHTPLQHQSFMSSPATRARFWARSFVGWPAFSSAAPTRAHWALAALAAPAPRGVGATLITQNVDRLITAAGARAVELHGTVHDVDCLDCGAAADRGALQAEMAARNARWAEHFAPRAAAVDPGDGAAPVRPDGDTALPAHAHESFVVPACAVCGGGRLKPRVVFFGGSLDPRTRAAARAAADAADAMIVVGTTCTVHSALSLVRAAAARGAPVAVVNRGATRADDVTTLRIDDADVGDTLAALARDVQRAQQQQQALRGALDARAERGEARQHAAAAAETA